jgi:hypothetical protein
MELVRAVGEGRGQSGNLREGKRDALFVHVKNKPQSKCY